MNCALGENNENLILKIPKINLGGSSLVRSESNTVGEMVEEKISVKNGDNTIESLFTNMGILNKDKVDLILKIDVEGYEYEVINGLKNTIDWYRPSIIIEYSPAFYIKNSATGDRSDIGIKTLQILKDIGYTMKVLDVGMYKNKNYKGDEIINWCKEFKAEQANLHFFKQ